MNVQLPNPIPIAIGFHHRQGVKRGEREQVDILVTFRGDDESTEKGERRAVAIDQMYMRNVSPNCSEVDNAI